MQLELWVRESIGHYSAKLFTLILTTLGLFGLAAVRTSSGSLNAQALDDWRKEVHEVLRDTEESFAQIRAMRREAGARAGENF